MGDNITLEEGLKYFQEKNKQYFSEKEYSKKGAAFLRCHDIAHVVFGCKTTVYGEGVVKTWTTFGTILSFWEVITGYK
ncbi:MAG: hypothetical protein AB8H12_20670 [Lewinella sp.]